MKCRHLQSIIPELVCGEVDERTTQLAEEHILECEACAAEYAAYERAMCALARPREAVEVPPALERLDLPEPVRKPGIGWMRPTFATAAMAAILASIMLMPRAPEPPVKHRQIARERVEQVRQSEPKVVDQPKQATTAKPRVSKTDRVSLYTEKRVRSQSQVAKADRSRGRAAEITTHTDKSDSTWRPKSVPTNDSDWSYRAVADSVETRLSAGYPVSKMDLMARDGDLRVSAAPSVADASEPAEQEGSVIVVTSSIEQEQVAASPMTGEDYYSRDEVMAGRTMRTVGDAVLPVAGTADMVQVETSDDLTGCVTYYCRICDDQGREQVIEITRCGPPT